MSKRFRSKSIWHPFYFGAIFAFPDFFYHQWYSLDCNRFCGNSSVYCFHGNSSPVIHPWNGVILLQTPIYMYTCKHFDRIKSFFLRTIEENIFSTFCNCKKPKIRKILNLSAGSISGQKGQYVNKSSLQSQQ